MHHTDLTNTAEPRLRILRRPAVQAETGEGRSSLYAKIADGLFPRPVKLVGSRAVGWPSNEVQQIVAATVAGASEDEMRSLVSRLMIGRKATEPTTAGVGA